MKTGISNRILSMIGLIMAFVLLFDCAAESFHAIAENRTVYSVGEYDIEVQSDQTCILVRCNTTRKALTLPCMINDYPVRTIGSYCFAECRNLRHVVISSSVYTIQTNAFMNASLLTTIVVPETVQTIDENAFDEHSPNWRFSVITASGSIAAKYCREHGLKCIETPETSLRIVNEMVLRMAGFVRIGDNELIAPRNMLNNYASEVVSEISMFDAALYGIADRNKYVSSLAKDLFMGEVNSYIKDLYMEQIAILLSNVNMHKKQNNSVLFKNANKVSSGIGSIAFLEEYWKTNWLFDDPAGVQTALKILSKICDGTSVAIDIVDCFGSDFLESVETLKIIKKLEGETSYPEAWNSAVNELANRYSIQLVDAIYTLSNEIENRVSKELVGAARDLVFTLAGQAAGSLYKAADIVIDTGVSLFGLKEKHKNFMTLALCLDMDNYFRTQYSNCFNRLSESDKIVAAELIDLEVLYNLALQSRILLFDAELNVSKNKNTRSSISDYKNAYEELFIDPEYYRAEVCYGEGTLSGANYMPATRVEEETVTVEEIGYYGLAAWWAGSSDAVADYIGAMDSKYGRVNNEVALAMPEGVTLGYEMNDWTSLLKDRTTYFSPYCNIIIMGYGEYDFEGKSVSLTESETLGWGGTDNTPTYRDEYYLFEVSSKDGVDTICIRMTNIGSTNVSVDGRMYASDSGKSDEVVEEAVSDDTTDATEIIARESDTGSDTGFEDADFDTPEPHSLSTVEPVLYENSLYAEFNEFSEAQYRETVTMFDNNYGRTTVVSGSIDGSDVGALAMEYIGASTGQELLYGLLSYPLYEQGSSGIEDVLKSYSKISLVQSELYGWGYNNGRNNMVDEYYRFGILNDEGAEYAFYHVAFRIGYETDGGDWAEGRVLYLESIPKVEAAQVDTDYEPDTQEVYEEPVPAEEEDDINESYDFGLINGLLSEVEEEFFDRYSWDQLTLLGDIVYPDGDTSDLTVGGLLNTVGGIYSIVVDCGEYVDIRAEATHSSRSLQKAYQGQGIPVLGFWGDWAICVCENYNESYPVCGWIETRYLMDEEAAAEADVYPEDYDSTPQNNGDDYYDNYDYEEYDYDSATGDDAAYYEDGAMEYLGTMVVGNCDEWVSLRESPDSSSGRLAEVYLGDTVEAYTFNQEWLICEYNGIWGYIKSMYLTLY